MATAQQGTSVKVHYTGKFEDGTEFDSSRTREPLAVTIGEQHVIQGFEDALVGMAVGDSKTVTLTPDVAYGDTRKELVVVLEKDKLPPEMTFEVGGHVELRMEDDRTLAVPIIAMDESSATVDANHPLAGQTLIFDLEMVEIS